MARFPFLHPLSGTRPRRADTLDAIAEPSLRRLADYWLSRRNGRPMPARADIDALDIPWVLPQLFLLDCLSDAGRGADGGRWRYRYRLAGDDIEKVFREVSGRHSLRGAWLDDIMAPEHLPAVMARWRPVPEDGCIAYMQGLIYRTENSAATGGRILLPLADLAGGPVTALIGATECAWETAAPIHGETASLTVTYIPVAVLG
jgi:hypothetical protein